MVICFDEFGPLTLHPPPGKQWAAKGGGADQPRRTRRATFTRPHGVRHLLAGYDLSTDRLYGHIKLTKARTQFLEFMRYLRTLHPDMIVTAVEALQCPTLLLNGFGGHRIEGIGDKHVPWIHNVRNTDMICAVDDAQCLDLLRLFNEEVGHEVLVAAGVDWVRKGAADQARLNPLDPPVKDMIQTVVDNGGKILVCPPCAEVRGYSQDDLLDGVVITGSPAMHALIKEGAATLCF